MIQKGGTYSYQGKECGIHLSRRQDDRLFLSYKYAVKWLFYFLLIFKGS